MASTIGSLLKTSSWPAKRPVSSWKPPWCTAWPTTVHVEEHLAAGVPTILEIDLQGARRVKQRAAELDLEVVYVFIAPPSFEELERRLIGRGTETAEQQARRLETAKVELAAESEFDVTIVNETVDQAAADLWSVIAKEYGL